MTKHYVDSQGTYLGGFEGLVPDGGIEVTQPPHGLATWMNGAWVMPPPSTDPNDYPLEPFQFEAMLLILSDQKGFDVGAAIDAAIAAIPDLTQRALAKAKRKAPPGGKFDREDPLFAFLAPTVGLTEAEIDTAWMTAKDF